MNEVFGDFFDVNATELFEPEAYAQAGAAAATCSSLTTSCTWSAAAGPSPRRHCGRSHRGRPSAPRVKPIRSTRAGSRTSTATPGACGIPRWSGLPIDPATSTSRSSSRTCILDSQVTIGLLSNVTASMVQVDGEPPRPPRNAEEAQRGEILTAAQTAAARNFVNEISGSTRMLCHGLLYVGKGNLAFIQEQIDKNEPDSWKGYNISNVRQGRRRPDEPDAAVAPRRRERRLPDVRADPEELTTRLKAQKPGLQQHLRAQGPGARPARTRRRGHPGDLPKAAQDWPKLNFITYHACIQPASSWPTRWRK